MDFTQDHFALFGLPRRFDVDAGELDRRYRDLQAQVHPDRHAHMSSADQRQAMQWSTRVNEAYRTLKMPLPRAEYLLSLAGVDVHRERAMPMEFLMRQMECRESVAAARAAGDERELDRVHRVVRQEIGEQLRQLEAQLDAGDVAAAAGMTRQLMFQEKLLAEVDDALAALDP